MKNLNDVLQIMRGLHVNSKEWNDFNKQKSKLLENEKPSTKETILYFNENDLDIIPEGFVSVNGDNSIFYDVPAFYTKRSLCEYNPTQRHPIPYIVLKYKDKYFFTLREKGSGESRLVGKKGLIGGHVGIDDYNEDVKKVIENGMFRELKEEVGVTKAHINNIKLKGIIKSNQGVDADHLGCIYVIELNTDKIKAEEEGVLTGMWINKEDLVKHYDSFENWSKIVYDNILKEN